ncbi:MAG: HD domain-containing protein [Actinobacteria bacterium]|nr:HD domain-containing protein [Actinomycetota bacterium]
MTSDRLRRQVGFIVELDKVKQVLRRTYLNGDGRRENDAEHMWHVAAMAVVLAEYAPPGLDLARVLRMIVLHDVVEIDAGDAFLYDDHARSAQAERERAAAVRIFGLLPPDAALEFRSLWDEFEARVTPEARFAAALDRLQPLLLNFAAEGRLWREHGVTRAQVIQANAPIGEAAPALWAYAQALIDEAVRRSYLAP